MKISFTIMGRARPQERARTAGNRNSLHFYDPDNSKTWKDSIGWQAISHGAKKRLPGPVMMTLRFFFRWPKSLPPPSYHTRTPDVSNLAKAVEDALKGIAYEDDSQIVTLIASKEYGDPPRIEIDIEEVKQV